MEENNTHRETETFQLLRRTNRVFRMLSKCNEAVLHASDEQELLSKICNIIVSEGGYRFAWVGDAEDNEARTVRPVGQCGFEDGYLETLCVSWADNEFGHGPTGKAIRTGRPSVVTNILEDPEYALWRPEALKRGYASAIAVPLIIDSKVTGTLNIYSAQPFFFAEEEETALLTDVGNNLSYGIKALRTRAALIRSEQRLKEAESICSMGSWELDLLTNKLVWSEEIYNIFEITPEKFGASYEHFLNTVHPEDKAMVDNAYSDSVKNKTQYDIVHRLLMSDGRIKFVHEKCRTFYDTQGTPLRSVGTVQDITERRRAEMDICLSENKYRKLHESIRDGFVSVDMTGTIREFNQAYQDMLGYSEDEIYSLKYTDITPEQWHSFEAKIVETQVTTRGYSDIYEKEYIRKDGTVFPVELRTYLIQDEHDFPTGMWSFVRDVTSRKKTEEVIRRNYDTQRVTNSLLQISLENISLNEILDRTLQLILSIPWLTFESKGAIYLAKEATDNLIMVAQKSLDEFTLKTCSIVPCGTCLCGRAATKQEIEFGSIIDDRHEIRYEGMAPHGHYCVPIVFSGKTLGLINIYLKEGHLEDTTEEEFLSAVANCLAGIIKHKRTEDEKEKMRTQLYQSQKMESIGRMASGIAHDFNNMLTAIIGFASLLEMNTGSEDPSRAYLDQIISASHKAAQLAQGLLAFSRKQVLDPKPVNLNEIITNVQKILSRVIADDIELKISLNDEDLTIMVDVVQLEQVLINLATNARDAMPRGGTFYIETDIAELDETYIKNHGYGKPGKYALFSVTDSGAGMDSDTQKHIFEPFYTTKETGKGTGLGLSIVYGIIKQHDGYINVYSEIGKGTTFKIYLPLVASESRQAKDRVVSHPQGGSETILLVEDDAVVRNFIKMALEKFGYKIIEAVDGEEGLHKFMENTDRVHLIILDVIMPKKYGREVCDEIKRLRPDIKVLFISGYTKDIITARALLEEGVEFIPKPITTNGLLRKVREVLDR
jgi:PAS domain S-box-containing protein